MAKPDLDERMKALGAAISSARSRFEHRGEFQNDEIGDLLATINEDFESVVHHDAAKAHGQYDAIEKRLADVEQRLDANR